MKYTKQQKSDAEVMAYRFFWAFWNSPENTARKNPNLEAGSAGVNVKGMEKGQGEAK